jgi:hypothetical protein
MISFEDAEEGLFVRWRVNGHEEASGMRTASPTFSYSENSFLWARSAEIARLERIQKEKKFLSASP